MTDCDKCDYKSMCEDYRCDEDYISPDGTEREIIGCTVNHFNYGKRL